MTIKRVLTLTTLAAAAAAVSASASLAVAAPTAKIVITHQEKGCHGWSLNGGAFKASQKLSLLRGGSVTIKNDDVMPHTLVQTGGPRATIRLVRAAMSGMGMHGKIGVNTMGRMGATLKVDFPKPGTYRFATKAGEDYMSGFTTTGEDNVLRLVVTVK
jgi:plastocyanin